ncbi:MAG TPA: DUF167 domain-containing protein [Thermomicrobiales bacterium]
MPAWLSDRPEGASLTIAAAPRSKQNAVGPVTGDALRVRVTAPAVEGAANAAVIALLAETLGVPKSRLRLIHGQTGKRKRILVEGMTAADILARLQPHLDESEGATRP